jgi:hypothetical protein
MSVQSHEITLTVDGADDRLKRSIVAYALMSVEERYRAFLVPKSLTIYHDRDQPYTARITWQTEDAT